MKNKVFIIIIITIMFLPIISRAEIVTTNIKTTINNENVIIETENGNVTYSIPNVNTTTINILTVQLERSGNNTEAFKQIKTELEIIANRSLNNDNISTLCYETMYSIIEQHQQYLNNTIIPQRETLENLQREREVCAENLFNLKNNVKQMNESLTIVEETKKGHVEALERENKTYALLIGVITFAIILFAGYLIFERFSGTPSKRWAE